MFPLQAVILSFILFIRMAYAPYPSSLSFDDFRAHMEKLSVIPDVIKRCPKYACEVLYIGGLRVDLGKELYPSQVQIMPWSITWPVEPDFLYTMIMTDPDYPDRKGHKQREFQHWVVVNIRGTGILSGNVTTEYYPPQPAEGTGPHRYVFTIFKQPKGRINVTERKILSKQVDHRGNFQTMKFAEKYGLGDPVAANLFTAQYTPEKAVTTPDYGTFPSWTLPPSTMMPRPLDI